MPDRSGTITLGGTAQVAAAAKPRTYLLVANPHTTDDLFFSFLGTAALNGSGGSIRLAAGRGYDISGPGIPASAISVISATTGRPFTVYEESDVP